MSHITDPYHFLQIHLNPDGTITRLREDPRASPSSSDPTLPVLSKDLTINQSHNTFARIYLPRKALDHSPSKRLPLIVFFHGGGFIFFSAASVLCQETCSRMANDVGSIVVSIEYRLAPEHLLPAAYDDAVEALHWIKTQPDDWLSQHADYSACYLMGSSAGANIAYRAGIREAAGGLDRLRPLTIRGLILVQPFFGGTTRCGSERRLENDAVLPPAACDVMWELALPVGVDRDHEYCNPTGGKGDGRLERVGRLGWRVLVTGCSGDPLVDRQVEVAKMMKERGVEVVGHFTEGDSHGIQDRDVLKAKELYGVVREFWASEA
ncbi:carboxylesterase 1-like [Senna tora]|uniref:Carboxylesterase 1-like n=1 Tax=Senna tora TaxID=362788 RepID=A0A834W7J7_9FABA|nr:carboxylesterase 1-like [Senna tora]